MRHTEKPGLDTRHVDMECKCTSCVAQIRAGYARFCMHCEQRGPADAKTAATRAGAQEKRWRRRGSYHAKGHSTSSCPARCLPACCVQSCCLARAHRHMTEIPAGTQSATNAKIFGSKQKEHGVVYGCCFAVALTLAKARGKPTDVQR
jgi:hypothetical protein